MSKCGKSIDHAVQAVGVNTEEGYWKVRAGGGLFISRMTHTVPHPAHQMVLSH